MDEPKVSWREMPAVSKVLAVVAIAVGGVLGAAVLAILLGLLARAIDWAWS